MLETGHVMAAITVIGFVVNLIVLVAGGTWKLTRMEASIRETLAQNREDADRDREAMRKDLSDQLEMTRREFGETAAALRTKIHEVEIFGRDTFIRRDSFNQFASSMNQTMESLSKRMENWMVRIEEKIDRRPPA